MERKKNDRKSTLMIISSMLIFGTIGIFRRNIPVSSSFLACSRGILGGAFVFAFMKLKHKDLKGELSSRVLLWLAVSGAVMGFNWILLFEAYNHTTVAVATLCYYMQPTIVMVLSPLIFNERLTVKKAICAGIAIIGMVLVSGVIGGNETGTGDVSGILLGLGAAVLYSAVVIMNKKIVGMDAYRKTTVQLLSAGVVMIPYMLITGEMSVGKSDWIAVVLLLVVGIVHTGIAYVLYFGSMDGLKAQSVAIISYIDPVAALLFSAMLLKEPLNGLGIIGAVMIIGSAIVCEFRA